jgi:hypothetical protein
VAFTVATAVLLEDQVTFWLDAFTGAMAAVRVSVWPAARLAAPGLTATDVTATEPVAAAVTFSSADAVDATPAIVAPTV